MDLWPVFLVQVLNCLHLCLSFTWEPHVNANEKLLTTEIPSRQLYEGSVIHQDYFKLLHTEGDNMLVGARNYLHNISLVTLEESLDRIEWTPSDFDHADCKRYGKLEEECQNYIRVLGKDPSGELLVCGTNAYKPWCRKYQKDPENGFEVVSDNDGTGKCPFSPNHNSTFVYTGGKLFAATAADKTGQDALIMVKASGDASSPQTPAIIRTQQHDSRWLNDPDFVASFDIEDKVYFFFRETATENINCGKTVFSRVARVCKKDIGGSVILKNSWTSFFKARLNCSIPGEFPFYLNEIQSITHMDYGNYMSTTDSKNNTKMFYAIFTTPENSIRASAVCAFTYDDIKRAFTGRFKGQKTFDHIWLPFPREQTPNPHPGEVCVNNSKKLSSDTLKFLEEHSLMDLAVPSAGGAPLLVKLSLSARFTKIAVDWQIKAADKRYYDIMFVGTDDGRVLKAINTGRGKDGSPSIESVIIEDLQIFESKEAVTDIKIFRNKQRDLERLIVMSRDNIVSIPLHRCGKYKTCSECIAIQDPYCSWVSTVCAASDRGLQNIVDGHLPACGPRVTTVTETKKEVTTVQPTTPPSPKCNCTCGIPSKDRRPFHSNNGEIDNAIPNSHPRRPGSENNRPVFRSGHRSDDNNRADDEDVKTVVAGAKIEQIPRDDSNPLSVAETAIAIVAAIVVSSLLSFVAGYKVRSCRGNEESDEAFLNEKQDIYGTIQKRHRSYSNSDNKEPRYINHADINNVQNSQKQSNLMVNIPKENNLPNGNAPVTPVKKLPPMSTEHRTYV